MSEATTHRAVLAALTFFIKLLSPLPENLTTNQQCSETHEDLIILGDVFDCQVARRNFDDLRQDKNVNIVEVVP